MSSQILTDSILQDSTTAGACPKPMLSTLHKKIRPFRGSWLQKTWCLRFRFQESGKCLWLYKMNHFFPHKKRAKTLGIRSFPSKKKQLPRRSQALSSCQSPLPCWERATSRATAHIKSRLRQKQLAMDGSKHITEMLSTRQIQRENGRMIIGNMG